MIRCDDSVTADFHIAVSTQKFENLVDGRAANAARYPQKLCQATCRGIVQDKSERSMGVKAVIDIGEDRVPFRYDLEAHHGRSDTMIQLYPLMKLTRVTNDRNQVSDAQAWDDLTGMRLDAGKVIEARTKEIQYVRDMGVWKKIPRRQAQSRG